MNDRVYPLNQKCDGCGSQPIELVVIPGPKEYEHLACRGCKSNEPFIWEVLKTDLPDHVERGRRLKRIAP